MKHSKGTSAEFSNRLALKTLLRENFRFLKTYLRGRTLHPFRAVCIRLIVFYQTRLSRHTCLFEPTCSEYTKRCISNHGVILGILMGFWRIMRCHPLAKGGYDPAPERFFRLRWLV